jgi:hypothetical protein
MTLPMQRFTGAGHKTLVIAFLWNFDFFLIFLFDSGALKHEPHKVSAQLDERCGL